MGVPAIQIMENAGRVKIYWDQETADGHIGYNLYYDTDSGMGTETLMTLVPNIVDGQYTRKHVLHTFFRTAIGYTEDTVFYLRLKGVAAGGSEDGSVGATKYVPAVSDKIPLYSPVLLMGNDGNVFRQVKTNAAGQLDVV